MSVMERPMFHGQEVWEIGGMKHHYEVCDYLVDCSSKHGIYTSPSQYS